MNRITVDEIIDAIPEMTLGERESIITAYCESMPESSPLKKAILEYIANSAK